MKVGITCSCFDLFHAGHVKMLQEAKSQCDYLIVALQTDPTIDRPNKNKPIQGLFERWVQLKSVRWVDEVIPYTTEKELEDILLSLPISVRILGEEYRDSQFTGKKICEDRQIKIIFNERKHNFSSTGLRNKIKNDSR